MMPADATQLLLACTGCTASLTLRTRTGFVTGLATVILEPALKLTVIGPVTPTAPVTGSGSGSEECARPGREPQRGKRRQGTRRSCRLERVVAPSPTRRRDQ